MQAPMFSRRCRCAPHRRAHDGVRADRLREPGRNPIAAAFGAGFLIEDPWGPSGPAAVTVGVASAAVEARGETASRHEIAIEADVRWKMRHGLAIQPLVQHVPTAGGRAGRNATIVGARVEWSPRAP